MKIEIINNTNIHLLNDFFKKCDKLNYKNNVDLNVMKLDWCKRRGEFFCAIKENSIIAVAGCHKFPQVAKWADNPWRILFRGCELPNRDTFKGLGKGDWNSITQREFIPIMINYCESKNLFLTTNCEVTNVNDKPFRNHRLMQLLEKQGILAHFADMKIYNIMQSIWKLNIDEYTRRRNLIGNNYVD